MIDNVTTFASPEQFRLAFENVITKEVQGTTYPGKSISTYRRPKQTSLFAQHDITDTVGVCFARSPKAIGNLDFFKGDLDQSCAVYSQLEVIRKVVLQAIQQENREASIPFHRSPSAHSFFERLKYHELIPIDRLNLPSSCAQETCTTRFHSVDIELYEQIVEKAIRKLFSSLGCDIFTGGESLFLVDYGEQRSVRTGSKLFQTMRIKLSSEAFCIFPEYEKIYVRSLWPECVATAYEKGSFTDFEIRAKDGTLKVHKLVLCSQLPYFAALNSFNGKESSENCLVLEKFAASSVKAALDFIYKALNPFEKKQNDVNAEEVLVLSDQWDLPQLKQLAAIEIGRHANCSQAAELRGLSEKFKLPFLEKVAEYLERKAAKGAGNKSQPEPKTSGSSTAPPEQPQKEVLPLDA